MAIVLQFRNWGTNQLMVSFHWHLTFSMVVRTIVACSDKHVVTRDDWQAAQADECKLVKVLL